MRMFRIAAFAPLLLLAACYSSTQPLFAPFEGRQPVPAGVYVGTVSGDVMDLTPRGRGVYMLKKGGESTPTTVTMVPLRGQRDTYLVQNAGDSSVGYSILRKGRRGFVMLTPDCSKEEDRGPARGRAANIDDSECSFDSPRALREAVSELASSATPDRWERYRPQ
ncbi:hypothetical protein ACFQ1E_04455 [Sphingomonas canadensis]|uniref:Lipoprotein n=1 Tax=Sphingomonas canadensis TaxID=1219257 RepID=A0ABW3H2C3_9SPHN|nr:hypothetical protein [Sphingomonas canadensis]MCW3834507.1 hypothetical protein [Sphingomonas canadensis]